MRHLKFFYSILVIAILMIFTSCSTESQYESNWNKIIKYCKDHSTLETNNSGNYYFLVLDTGDIAPGYTYEAYIYENRHIDYYETSTSNGVNMVLNISFHFGNMVDNNINMFGSLSNSVSNIYDDNISVFLEGGFAKSSIISVDGNTFIPAVFYEEIFKASFNDGINYLILAFFETIGVKLFI